MNATASLKMPNKRIQYPGLTGIDRQLREKEQREQGESLTLADLARSGLDADAMEAMGIRSLTATETRQDCGMDAPSYYIPYFHPFTGAAWAGRYRLTDKPSNLADEKKDFRYMQAKGTPLHLYFFPGLDWKNLLANAPADKTNGKTAPAPAKPKPPAHIYITEGEKKAAKACVDGLPCIGIAGVESWQSKKKGFPMLPDFDLVDWTRRPVTVLYDSDHDDNINIRKARWKLLDRLTELGAVVSWGKIPAGPKGEKRGLDDLLLEGGREAFSRLELQAHDHKLELLNDRYCYVKQTSAMWDGVTRRMKKPHAFRDDNAPEKIRVLRDGRVQETKLGRAWCDWPGRLEVNMAQYAPGHGRFAIDPERGEQTLNLWPGLGVRPVRNDSLARYGADNPGLWYNFLAHRSKPQSAELQAWELAWMYSALRFAGMKNQCAIILRGDQRGVGKSLQCEIIRAVYGQTGKLVDMKALESAHNAEMATMSFGLIDEAPSMYGSTGKKIAIMLRGWMTRTEIRVEPKGIDAFYVADVINWMLTTNEIDLGLFDDIVERKYYVSDSPHDKRTQGEYQALVKALKSGDLPSAILYDVLNNPLVYPRAEGDEELSEQEQNAMRQADPAKYRDLQEAMLKKMIDPWPDHKAPWDKADGPKPLLWNWNPGAEPPMTKAKREMANAGMPDLKRWLLEAARDPESVLRPLYEKANNHWDRATGRLLYTAEELRHLYQIENPRAKPPSVQSIGKYLKALLCHSVTIYIDRRRITAWLMVLPPESDADTDDAKWAIGIRAWIARTDGGPGSDARDTNAPTLSAAYAHACANHSPAERDAGPSKSDLIRLIGPPVDLLSDKAHVDRQAALNAP